MSRFIRSALFPILIVIIVAMFIQYVISNNKGTAPAKPIYSAPGTASLAVLTSDLQNDFVKSVVIDTQSSKAEVTQTGGIQYFVTQGISNPTALEQQIKTDHPKVAISTGTVTPPSTVQPSFTNDVINGKVANAVLNVKDQTLAVTLKKDASGKQAQYTVAYTDPASTTALLDQYNVAYDATSPKSAWWSGALAFVLPFILIIGLWIFMMNQMQGGGSKVMSFGKSRAKRVSVDSPKVTFKDVAGADEAVEELHEIKEFLENPKKFQQLGARIPKGVLLFGPPGCGKTMIVKAAANELKATFLSISGADLLKMGYEGAVGQIKDAFNRAKESPPAIIFIDEIDAIAPSRELAATTPLGEKMVAQLLNEMDGVKELKNVMLIGATNRPDIIDTALLRPGRFDKIMFIHPPLFEGRAEIFRNNLKGIPLAEGFNFKELSNKSDGYSGADITSACQEAKMSLVRGRIAGKRRELTYQDLLKIIGTRRPSITPKMLHSYMEFLEEYGERR